MRTPRRRHLLAALLLVAVAFGGLGSVADSPAFAQSPSGSAQEKERERQELRRKLMEQRAREAHQSRDYRQYGPGSSRSGGSNPRGEGSSRSENQRSNWRWR